MLSDQEFAELMTQLRAGSQQAAETLFRHYGEYIVRIVKRRLRRARLQFEAQDVSQSVWASFLAVPDRGEFVDARALVAYLARAARNKIIDATRLKTMPEDPETNRERSLDGSAAFVVRYALDPQPRASELMVAEDEWDLLLDKARPRQRVMLRRLRQGTSPNEIAAELNLDPKTVKRALDRMIERLRGRRAET